MRVGCQYERVRYSGGGTISCGMTQEYLTIIEE